MARNENPPFKRGETFYNGSTIDSNNLGGLNYEGHEYLWEDNTPYSVTGNSGRFVKTRVVRNVAAIALLPGRLVTEVLGNSGRVDGYVRTTAGFFSGVVDEYLPTAGVPVNDLFHMVIEGPTQIRTALAGSEFGAAFAAGDRLVALTAATSGATTAGRPAAQDLTGATALLANQIQNCKLVAISAATTGNTNTLIRAELRGVI